MCGENSNGNGVNLWAGGSPPRVRGKLIRKIFYILFDRITPACAGKTINDYEKSSYAKDHPRVCGENSNPR